MEKVTYKFIHLSHAVWNNFSNHIATVADKRRFYWCKLHSIRWNSIFIAKCNFLWMMGCCGHPNMFTIGANFSSFCFKLAQIIWSTKYIMTLLRKTIAVFQIIGKILWKNWKFQEINILKFPGGHPNYNFETLFILNNA